MDPQVTWGRLLAAYAAGDWDQIEALATDLIAWLDRGGFPPMIIHQPEIDSDWNRTLARAGCLHALEVVQGQWNIPP